MRIGSVLSALPALAPGELTRLKEDYNPDEPRDYHGRWGDGGGGSDVKAILDADPQRAGENPYAYAARVTNGLDAATKHETIFRIREQYTPVPRLAAGATAWRDSHGLPNPQTDITGVRAPMAKADTVGRAFETTPSQAGDPRVQAAFADFKAQNAAQYSYLTTPTAQGGLGIKVDYAPNAAGDPYPTAAAQAADLRDNNHITIQSGLGGDHSATMSTQEYDQFRAVHDSFGHAAIGGGFDRHGEYQAWLAHMSMYTGAGRDAMSSEYHGVNTALWGGAAGTPGTGKSILLPANLITNPWDSKGNLVREAASTGGVKLSSEGIDALIKALGLDGDFANRIDNPHLHPRSTPWRLKASAPLTPSGRLHRLREEYNPDEPRDYHGRWGDGGGSSASIPVSTPGSHDMLAGYGLDNSPVITHGGQFTPQQVDQMNAAVRDAAVRNPELVNGPSPLASVSYLSGGIPPGMSYPDWLQAKENMPNTQAVTFPADIAAAYSGSYFGERVLINDSSPFDPSPDSAPSTMTPYGVVTHEMGHAFFISHGMETYNETSSLLKASGLTPDILKSQVSDYAASDPREALAEMYGMKYTPGFGLPSSVLSAYKSIERSVGSGTASGSRPLVTTNPDISRQIRAAAAANVRAKDWVMRVPFFDSLQPAPRPAPTDPLAESAHRYGLAPSELRRLREDYNPDEPRDSHGRWGDGGGDQQAALKTSLEQMRDIRGATPSGLTHNSYESYVLDHGRSYPTPTEAAPEGMRGTPKECYKNCMDAVLNGGDYTYVEGYTNIPGIPQLPIAHAWLVDNQTGATVDPTIRSDQGSYFGVPFTLDQVRASVLDTGVYGMFQPRLIKESARLREAYNPDEPRDWHGRWGDGGGGAAQVINGVGGLRGEAARQAIVTGASPDTIALNTNSAGQYTPEREALHQQIVARYTAGATPQDNPRAIFTAGGPASGKAGLAGASEVAGRNLPVPSGAVVVNPDDIKSQLPEYAALQAAGRSDIAGQAVHEESSAIGKQIAAVALANRYNVIVDGSVNSPVGHFGDKIRAALGRGYSVDVRYAHVPLETALAREAIRYEATGRKVGETALTGLHQTVTQSYVGDVKNIVGAHVSMYSTAGDTPRLIADKPAGTAAMTVLDPTQYAQALAKANG